MTKALLVFLALAAFASGNTVFYNALGTFTTPSLNTGGVTVTGSANINVANSIGLGIVGGTNNGVVDGSEYIEFFFNGGSVTDVSYNIFQASNLDGDAFLGERFLEAFNAGGASLGTIAQNSALTFQVSSLFGNVPISRFRLTADVDGFTLDSVTFTAATVPEPSTYWLLVSGLALIFYLRRASPRGGLLKTL